MKPVFSGLLALMTFAGCGIPAHVREFAAIGSVTSITVSRHSDPPETAKITGKAAISEVVDFVDAHRIRWSTPWSGIPVPAVTVEFYDGMEFKGSFGVADNFFETQRDGGFFSQSVSPAEVLAFLKLVSFRSASTIASNEREHVLDGDFRIITAVGELPTHLKTAFAALTKESRFEMADPGHTFQLTDVIDKLGLPRRRLNFAGISREQMFLHYEMGGRGHAYYLVVFANSQPEAKLIWGGTFPKPASTLAQLQVGVSTPSGSPTSSLSF